MAALKSGLPALLCALGACSGDPGQGGPVGWWHGLEGGPIAADRPAPPGQTAPYPNLVTVPGKPTPVDPATRSAVYAALAADRANARYEADQAPIAPQQAAPQDENGLFAPAKPATPAPDDTAAGAALDAASPTGARAKPPAKSPSSAEETQPDPLSQPIPAIAADTTPPPPIPDQPPPPPRLQGVAIPVTIAHLPPQAPPAPPPRPGALSAQDAAPVSVAFPAGSAVLTIPDRGALKALAARRAGHPIEITGFGEADGEDSQSQYAGIQLGLLRARAIAALLESDGVPFTDLRLAAVAPGRGAAARLID